MSTPFDHLFPAEKPEPRITFGRGGARHNLGNSGRKPKNSAPGEGSDDEWIVDQTTGQRTRRNDYQKREWALAEKERALARQARVKADLDEGRAIDADEVRAAVATLLAACSQALDSIPDSLERAGVSIDVIVKVSQQINSAKLKLATDLAKRFKEAQNADVAE